MILESEPAEGRPIAQMRRVLKIMAVLVALGSMLGIGYAAVSALTGHETSIRATYADRCGGKAEDYYVSDQNYRDGVQSYFVDSVDGSRKTGTVTEYQNGEGSHDVTTVQCDRVVFSLTG